ncbi:MAG: sulfotransferase family protein [Acidimicrobiales bacterium]
MLGPGQVPHSPTMSGATPSGDRPLSVDALVAGARTATGLQELGDAQAIEALGVLVESIETEARPSAAGRRRMGAMLGDLLQQRLRMVDFAATSDVVDYETVRSPIVVTGLPRTGTTMLADLLAQDPFNRALLGWQAATVAPPPTLADLGSDPRLREALARDERRDGLVPDLPAKRALGATRPTECVQLLATSFASLSFETILDVPGYAAWCDAADMIQPYRFHHLGLRTLQTTVPTERWSLKSPAHLWHLDALRAVYPDARLIVTHRDPAKVVPSVASLCTTLRSMFSDAIDPEAVGRQWRARCHHALEVSAAHLADWDPATVFHLPYAELVDDPVGSIERAYQRFGFDLCDLGRRRMAAWHEQHPRDRNGAHRYDASSFGLDEGALRREFAGYMADHHVPSEL